MTSAPCSARVRPAAGPATMFEKSSTRTPSRSPPAPSSAPLPAAAAGRSTGGASHSNAPPAAAPARSAGERTASFSMERKRPGCRTGPRSGSSRSVVTPAARRFGSASHSALVWTIDTGTFAARIIASHSLAGRVFAAAPMSSMRRLRHAGVRLAALLTLLPASCSTYGVSLTIPSAMTWSYTPSTWRKARFW